MKSILAVIAISMCLVGCNDAGAAGRSVGKKLTDKERRELKAQLDYDRMLDLIDAPPKVPRSERFIILTQADADKLNALSETADVRVYDDGPGGDCDYKLGQQYDGTRIYLRVDSPHPKLDVWVVRVHPKGKKPGQGCDYHETEWGWSEVCAPTVRIEARR